MRKNDLKKRIGAESGEQVPRTSVVIPAYNVAEFIAETLDSAFAQTDRDFEVIVINDGSPDTELLDQVLEPYLEKIIYIVQPNAGASIARNTGIRNARGRYIAFLDGDDIWHADYLSSQLDLMAAGSYSMVYCDAELFGVPSVAGTTFMQGAPSSGKVDVNALLDLRCNVITSGTIALRSAIEKAGMFEDDRVHSEDFNLWVRIAHSGEPIGFQRDVLLKYRVRSTGMSSDSIYRVTRVIDVFKRLDRDVDLTAEQRAIITRRLTGFEADLAVETGKAHLLSGEFKLARKSFATANKHRRSLKLSFVSILSAVAPRALLKLYKSKDKGEIAFVPEITRVESRTS